MAAYYDDGPRRTTPSVGPFDWMVKLLKDISENVPENDPLNSTFLRMISNCKNVEEAHLQVEKEWVKIRGLYSPTILMGRHEIVNDLTGVTSVLDESVKVGFLYRSADLTLIMTLGDKYTFSARVPEFKVDPEKDHSDSLRFLARALCQRDKHGQVAHHGVGGKRIVFDEPNKLLIFKLDTSQVKIPLEQRIIDMVIAFEAGFSRSKITD